MLTLGVVSLTRCNMYRGSCHVRELVNASYIMSIEDSTTLISSYKPLVLIHRATEMSLKKLQESQYSIPNCNEIL